MDNLEKQDTVIIDLSEQDSISSKLAAINNRVRFSILKILRDFQKINDANKGTIFEKDPLYSREINSKLLNKYNIDITTQMLGQHLKQLQEAGMIEEVIVQKEVPNKVGLRSVKGYQLKIDAFEDLLLDINFFTDELLNYFSLSKINRDEVDDSHCMLTIFNGKEKGKTFTVSKDEVVLIGRKSDMDVNDLAAFTILLDNSYNSVSSVSKPHLKLFYKDNGWYVLDDSSTNGSYILDKKIPTAEVTKLRNNTILKLSKGKGSAIIYCCFQ